MRRSRWSRDPILIGGKPKIAQITERDIEIFKLLARYRYLSLHYIHAFVGGNLTALRDRLDLLNARPNCFVDIPADQHRNAHANYRALIYQLDENGSAELRKRGFPSKRPTATPFPHEVMSCQIAASIELALRADPSLKYVPHELKPIPVRLKGKVHTILSDRHPFALGTEGNRKFYYGHEAHTGSQSIKTVVRGKLEKYFRIIEDKLQKKVYDARTFYVLYVCQSPDTEAAIIKLILEMTRGKGSEFILLKNIPLFYSDQPSAPATGHMVTEPWKRAGFPDFYMVA